MRIFIVCCRATWTEHSARAANKKCGMENMAYFHKLAGGSWLLVLAATVRDSLYTLENLTFMGVNNAAAAAANIVTPNEHGVDPAVVLRIFQFTVNLLATRAWSLVKYTHSYPGKFALVLRPVVDAARLRIGLDVLKHDWAMLMQAEQHARHNAALAGVIREAAWPLQTACRCAFMMLERGDFLPTAHEGLEYCEDIFNSLGDTKCIEDTHRAIKRDIEKHQDNNVTSRASRMHSAICSGVLSERNMEHLPVRLGACDDLGDMRFSKLFTPARKQLPKVFSRMLDNKRTWPSPTPETAHENVAAWQWPLRSDEKRNKHIVARS